RHARVQPRGDGIGRGVGRSRTRHPEHHHRVPACRHRREPRALEDDPRSVHLRAREQRGGGAPLRRQRRSLEDRGVYALRPFQRPRRRAHRGAPELGAAVARPGLRAGRHRGRGDRRDLVVWRRGFDPRDRHRRIHHQHAHERAANHVGAAGVADGRHGQHRHHRRLPRHRPPAASGMSGSTITALEALDVRFPTSRTLAGSDAMNTAPDYSATYVILRTDRGDKLSGHGLAFTTGRGNEVVLAAANALRPLIVGKTIETIAQDMGHFWREITGDPPLRWIGPDKGAMHLATSAGWLGYSDEKIRALCREAVNQGWTHVKIKVGRDIEDDMRRARIVREEIGDRKLMMDANQVWDVGEAIANTKRLAKFDPYWMEEPTSPDDVLGHATIAKAIAPIRVATGEHCQNRVIFKQLLQAKAIGFCQVDACRLGGVNEVLAVLLMAAKFGVPVCPHAGGVGLCEYVQHIAIFDYVAVSGSLEDR